MLDTAPFVKEMVVSVKRAIADAIDPIRKQLESLERRLLEIPAGKDGLDGKDGKDGADGKNGQPGKDGEPGKDGRDGKDGKDAEKAIDGRDGRDGLPGLPGKNGENGADGQDGFGLEDFDVALGEDGRTFCFRFVRGDVVIEKSLRLPVMLYRGVWKDGGYEHGDTVTWDGSSWHANKATAAKPGTGSEDWTMCNKRGNNGRDGKDGSQGIQGKDGKPGRDMTQLGFDGGRH